jgi:hypothetical protein
MNVFELNTESIIKYLDYKTFINLNLTSKGVNQKIKEISKESEENYYKSLCKSDYKVEKLRSKEKDYKFLYDKLRNLEFNFIGYSAQVNYMVLFGVTLKIKKNKSKIKGTMKWSVMGEEKEMVFRGKFKNDKFEIKKEENGGFEYDLMNIDNIGYIGIFKHKKKGNWGNHIIHGGIYIISERFLKENKCKKKTLESTMCYEGYYTNLKNDLVLKKNKITILKDITIKWEKENLKMEGLKKENNEKELPILLFGDYLLKVFTNKINFFFFFGKLIDQ